MLWFVVILDLLFISGFAGFLPVVAEGVVCKWLIISVFLVFLVCTCMYLPVVVSKVRYTFGSVGCMIDVCGGAKKMIL